MARPKGSKNSYGAEVKNLILASFGHVGGIEYLKQQAKENPSAYMTLLGKAIPKELAIEIERNAWDAIDEVENANGNPEATEV